MQDDLADAYLRFRQPAKALALSLGIPGGSLPVAAELMNQVASLSAQLVAGADANGDGRVTWNDAIYSELGYAPAQRTLTVRADEPASADF